MLDALSFSGWEFATRNGHHWYKHTSRLYRCSRCGITCRNPSGVAISCPDLQAFQHSYQVALNRARALIALWGMAA